MNTPKGYKMVPVEPTEEMMRAGLDVSNTLTKWQVMLAAAPLPPQGEEQPVGEQVAEYLTTLAARQNVQLSTERDIYRSEVERLLPEIDSLRAQLAERAALLSAVRMNSKELLAAWVPSDWEAKRALLLSASAEPGVKP